MLNTPITEKYIFHGLHNRFFESKKERLGNIINNDVKAMPITEEEVPKAIDLIQRVFSQQEHFKINRNLVWWEWKYKLNVFGAPIFIIAKTKREEIVGTRAFWPWHLTYRGSRLKAYQSVETVVAPKYRGLGLFRLMTENALQEALKAKADFIFNFPNKQSLPGYLKLDWELLGHIEWSVKILKPINALFSMVKKDKYAPIELPKEFSFTKDKAMSVFKNIDQSHLINTHKTREFYTWRYVNHPCFKYGIINDSNADSTASAIFMVNGNNSGREMIVTDIEGSPLGIRNVFKKLVSIAKSLDVAIVAAISNKDMDNAKELWQLGFFPLKAKNFAVLPLNPLFAEETSRIENWNLSGNMHDTL